MWDRIGKGMSFSRADKPFAQNTAITGPVSAVHSVASLVEPLCGRDLDFAELAWVVIICSWCRNPLRPLSGTLSALLLLLRARTIGPLTRYAVSRI